MVVGVHVDPGEVPYLVVVHGEVGHHGQVEAHQVHQDVKVFEGGLEEEDLWVQGLACHEGEVHEEVLGVARGAAPDQVVRVGLADHHDVHCEVHGDQGDHEAQEDHVVLEVHEDHVDHHEAHHESHYEGHGGQVDLVVYGPFLGEACHGQEVAFLGHLDHLDRQGGHLDPLAHLAVGAVDLLEFCSETQTD